jgi:outer membrane biosynthesis protein TonB
MDRITQRSAVVSTTLHALLVALAFWPRGCGCSHTPPSAAAMLEKPVQPTEPARAVTPPTASSRLIAVPRPAPVDPPLPALDDTALPPLPVDPGQLITAASSGGGTDTARGKGGTTSAPVKLPALAPEANDLTAQLRARRTTNQQMDAEQANLHASHDLIERRLRDQIDHVWRHLKPRMREHRLVVEVVVQADGAVKARLVNSSGAPELDRLVDDWLRNAGLQLAPMRVGMPYPFLVVIPP